MAGKWSVVSQRQSERLTSSGAFESIVTVTFQLASGTTGSVAIPSRLYSEDYVRQQVDEKATAMIAVENLAG